MATDARTAVGDRSVTCYRCTKELRVSSKALSLFCPHCHQRLVLENIRITTSHPGRELMTCGDLVVEPGAKLHIQRIVAGDVVIRGRVIATVTANGTLEIAKTGIVEGDVEAGSVVVREGGVLKGRCRMIRRETTTAVSVPLPAGSPAMPPDPPPAAVPVVGLPPPPAALGQPRRWLDA